MTLFPEWFLTLIVYGGIALSAIGAVALLVLLLHDARRGRLW